MIVKLDKMSYDELERAQQVLFNRIHELSTTNYARQRRLAEIARAFFVEYNQSEREARREYVRIVAEVNANKLHIAKLRNDVLKIANRKVQLKFRCENDTGLART